MILIFLWVPNTLVVFVVGCTIVIVDDLVLVDLVILDVRAAVVSESVVDMVAGVDVSDPLYSVVDEAFTSENTFVKY